MWNRREWLAAVVGAAGCTTPQQSTAPVARTREPKKLLLRAGWRSDSIGDTAQVAGMVRLVRMHAPEAEVVLWSNSLDRGVKPMLLRAYPRLRFVEGDVDASGQPDSPALAEAFRECEFLLHGSGPDVMARDHLRAWRAATRKPYGIFGVSIPGAETQGAEALDQELRQILDGAVFVFARESVSLEALRQAGIMTRIGSAPDAACSLKLANREAALEFLKRYELVPKQFLAVVPRLRQEPSAEEPGTDVSLESAAADHEKLRQVIVRWVRETGYKVVLCAEKKHQMDLLYPLLYRALPEEIKSQVVRQPLYWLTDTASSVYRRAAAMVTLECHSGIIAAANDTPGIYLHQPEAGLTGRLWQEAGLDRWYFEIEQTGGKEIADRLLEIHENSNASQVDVHEAVIYARKLQSDAMTVLRQLLWPDSV